jgi:hypothetical protein
LQVLKIDAKPQHSKYNYEEAFINDSVGSYRLVDAQFLPERRTREQPNYLLCLSANPQHQ